MTMLLIANTETFPTSDDASVAAERRRGLRIRQNRPVKIFDPTSTRYFAGQTCDVSSTGLRVELPPSMPVRTGNVINIHVGLSEAGEPLANRRSMLPARVVWLARRLQNGKPKMTVGVEFVSSISAHLDAA
jgi:hypothetical protein